MEKAYKLEPTLDKIDLINLQFFTYNEDKMKCFYGELPKLPNEIYEEVYEEIYNDPSLYFKYVAFPSERPLGNSENITIGDLKAKVIYGTDNKTPLYNMIFVERDGNNYIISFIYP